MRGHVRQRGRYWSIVIDEGRDETGKRRQRWYSGFATKRAAEQRLTELLGKLDAGTYTTPTKLAFGPFLDTWLKTIRADIEPSTFAVYETLVRCHVRPRLGGVQLQRITPGLLNEWYADLLEKGRTDAKGGLSRRSVNYIHTTVRKALAEAVKQGLLQRNPADLATPPRQKRERELAVWSAEELRRFLIHTSGHRFHAAFVLAAFTGARRGEILGLRWRDIDLDRGALTVNRALRSVNYKLSIAEPKTAAGRRQVALDPGTVDVLRRHRATQLEERLLCGLGRPEPDSLAFSTPLGDPVHPNSLSDAFDRAVKSSGLPRIPLHGLRHTHATVLLTANVHPKVVQERLGHSNVEVTLSVYSHVIPALQSEAAAKFAAAIDTANTSAVGT